MSEKISAPWPAGAQRLRLGSIEIDLRYRSIHRDGAAYEVTPRSFDVLRLFLREPYILHSRDEIFRKVWPGVIVEDANLTSCVWTLRRALGGEAKQWIRTVSRQGYVFDPPQHLQLEPVPGEAALPETDTDDSASPDVPSPVEEPGASPSEAPPPLAVRPRPPMRIMALAAAAFIGCALLLVAYRQPASRQSPVAHVVLVAPAASSLAEEARWPTRLLHDWLDWQLRSNPGFVVRGPDEMGKSREETVVLLAVRRGTTDGEWRVSAQFRGLVKRNDILRIGDAASIVTMISEVSREAVMELGAPEMLSAPELAIDAETAPSLVAAMEAEAQCQWGDAAQAYRHVLEQAPSTGFARFRLARVLAQLGQQGAAQSEMARAETWIATLPEILREPIRAEEKIIRQDYAAAALAYAALQRGGSEIARYRVAEAQALRQAGRSAEAAGLLANDVPETPALAVHWLIERARAEIANRDSRAAGAAATRALDMARTLGWKHESAQAGLLLADALNGAGERVSPQIYEDAEAGFAAVGDRLGVLRARVLAELARGIAGGASSSLDALLAEARSAGNVALEIDALRRTWMTHYRAGDMHEARRRSEQAAAVAQAAGNTTERRRVDLYLLHQDLLRLDFDTLDRRLEQLRGEPQQGIMAYSVGLYTARMHYLRGQFAPALEALDAAEEASRASASGDAPSVVGIFDCMRAAIFVAQGKPAEARTGFRDCRSARIAAFEQFADLGEADLAIQVGAPDVARRLVEPMIAHLPDESSLPDRWTLVMDIVPIWARLGEVTEARHLIDDILPAVQASGLRMLEANLRISRAEIALAERRIDAAEAEIAAVDALVPADHWFERRRMRTVRALVAQARGDTAGAARMLDTLHADARAHQDVSAELQVHSLIEANPLATSCTDPLGMQLLATSGLRGTSDQWMLPSPPPGMPPASLSPHRNQRRHLP